MIISAPRIVMINIANKQARSSCLQLGSVLMAGNVGVLIAGSKMGRGRWVEDRLRHAILLIMEERQYLRLDCVTIEGCGGCSGM